MSVLIRGMEMPKNCDKCIYSSWSNFYQIYVCNAVRKYEPVLFDKKQTKSTDIVRSGRADNCPLVPVPPHGDLIDKDATMNAILEERGEDTACWFAGIVNDMPAVIPSDKAEEGE